MYINKRAKAGMVSNEGKFMEINNEDSMRAIVGEIVCVGESPRISSKTEFENQFISPNLIRVVE